MAASTFKCSQISFGFRKSSAILRAEAIDDVQLIHKAASGGVSDWKEIWSVGPGKMGNPSCQARSKSFRISIDLVGGLR